MAAGGRANDSPNGGRKNDAIVFGNLGGSSLKANSGNGLVVEEEINDLLDGGKEDNDPLFDRLSDDRPLSDDENDAHSRHRHAVANDDRSDAIADTADEEPL